MLGYDGEPYLEVRPDGVFENINSPATYLNETLQGGEVPPDRRPDRRRRPWRRATDEPVARWHDHRSHWMSATPPPQVTAEPDRAHRIRDWVVPLRSGVTTVEVTRHAGLGAAADRRARGGRPLCSRAAAVGRARACATAPERWRRGAALAVLVVVGGLTAIGYAVARELDAGSTAVGDVLLGLLAGQVWPVLAGLAAVAAGAYALARRPSADFAMALAGACLALFAGVANSTVFGRGGRPGAVRPDVGPGGGGRR